MVNGKCFTALNVITKHTKCCKYKNKRKKLYLIIFFCVKAHCIYYWEGSACVEHENTLAGCWKGWKVGVDWNIKSTFYETWWKSISTTQRRTGHNENVGGANLIGLYILHRERAPNLFLVTVGLLLLTGWKLAKWSLWGFSIH